MVKPSHLGPKYPRPTIWPTNDVPEVRGPRLGSQLPTYAEIGRSARRPVVNTWIERVLRVAIWILLRKLALIIAKEGSVW